MTIINAYTTLADLQAFLTPRGQSITANVADDAVLERLIAAISRYIDTKTGNRFYPRIQTRWFDVPDEDSVNSRNLPLDDDLCEVLTLTNGNGEVVPSTEYYFLHGNDYPKTDICLKGSSTYQWLPDTSGNILGVIAVNAIWVYRQLYDQQGWYQAGTLSAAMTDTTTLSFPTTTCTPVTSQIFRIDNEILIAASYSSPTCTVQKRGDNGSTATTHLINAPIYLWQTQEDISLAVLETCNNIVSSRMGQSSSGRITVTAAGIVIRPDDLSAFAKDTINSYRGML